MNQEILKKAIEKFGVETQVNKIQEECLELALILNQMKCPTKEINLIELHSELADVKIMMAQAELIFDNELIDSYVELKLKRLEEKYLQD